MIREGHLSVYDLKLTLHAPLFIGSGRVYSKKEYCYDSRSQTVRFLNQERLFSLLAERKLVDAYESFILGSSTNLYAFLRDTCGLQPAELKQLTRYTVSAANALDNKHSLKEIHSFVRNPFGKVYLPGSSVKGALRTILLTEMMRKSPPRNPPTAVKKKDRDREMSNLEGQYLNTLHCKLDRNGNVLHDAANSILRGLLISDSEPIDDAAMILCTKWDDSLISGLHKVSLCRECIRPGTEIHLKLTLDDSILQGKITASSLKADIDSFDTYYRDTYVSVFDKSDQYSEEGYYNSIILGGGAGFFSKTVAYPMYGNDAVRIVSDQMKASFSQHKHEQDTVISPHTMKYSDYQGMLYPYGVCEVELL